MIFKVPSNPKHSMIQRFYELQRPENLSTFWCFISSCPPSDALLQEIALGL